MKQLAFPCFYWKWKTRHRTQSSIYRTAISLYSVQFRTFNEKHFLTPDIPTFFAKKLIAHFLSLFILQQIHVYSTLLLNYALFKATFVYSFAFILTIASIWLRIQWPWKLVTLQIVAIDTPSKTVKEYENTAVWKWWWGSVKFQKRMVYP